MPEATLKEITERITSVPEGFNVHKTIQRFIDNRRKAVESGRGDRLGDGGERWPSARCCSKATRSACRARIASAALLSQRHSVLIDQETEERRHTSLNNLREGQARYEVINSMLSEEAVLGFEYGYSLSEPNALTMWEAQFGDFANGAQVVFDQFISSGERKWLRMSGLVCLLPHGYEGQGPEHSSARLERFLQMCAEDNMQVANCTTPANYFHILRRQMKRDFRKPLILMTPKSLLRHKRCVSDLSELAEGSTFHRVLHDDAERGKSTIKLVKDSKIRRVVLCSGKVYYDLLEEREKRGIDDVYLLRLEQLYPFPLKSLAQGTGALPARAPTWSGARKSPRTMGAWTFVDPYLEWVLAHIAGNRGSLSARRATVNGRPSGPAPPSTKRAGLMRRYASSPPTRIRLGRLIGSGSHLRRGWTSPPSHGRSRDTPFTAV